MLLNDNLTSKKHYNINEDSTDIADISTQGMGDSTLRGVSHFNAQQTKMTGFSINAMKTDYHFAKSKDL